MVARLVARDVWKSFPGVQALRSAEITVPPGKVVAVVGKNGAGKSVLMSILAGADVPDKGQVVVGGESVKAFSTSEARRLGIALVRQEVTLVPGFTALENIALAAGYPTWLGALVDWRRVERLVEPVVDMLGIRVSLRTVASQLGPSDQRLIMIAGGLLRKARIVILDEPTVAFSPPHVERLFKAIGSLAAEGVSVLYVSQRLDEVLQVADDVVVLRDGQTVGQWPVKEVRPSRLVELITGRPSRSQPGRGGVPRRDGTEVLRSEGLCGGVIQDVSIRIREGEIVGLCGLSGSGKSALVRLLGGVERPASGAIHVRGRRAKVRHPRHAIKAGIVLSPQDRAREGLVLGMTVRENITLPSVARLCLANRLPVLSRVRERRKSRKMVDQLSVVPADIERSVAFLSGGNQQKVVLAKWLATDADLFMFDEPTAGLDIEAKAQILQLLRDLVSGTEAAKRRAVVVISSDLSDLETLCDRVYVLRTGRVVAELTGSNVNEATMLAHAVGADQDPGENA